MDIEVILSSQHTLKIVPDPAVVHRGEQVRWLYTGPAALTLTWTLYFDHGTPFNSRAARFSTKPGARSVITLVPEVAGDWKYGIEARDGDTEETLADDDPHLIVL